MSGVSHHDVVVVTAGQSLRGTLTGALVAPVRPARCRLDRLLLGHLDREVTIPVTDGIQAQGDLLVVPIALLAPETSRGWAWRNVSIADSAR